MSGGRMLIFAAWMGIFVYGYLNAMLGVVLPNLMAKLKLDKSQAATFFMISSFGLLVAAIPSGWETIYRAPRQKEYRTSLKFLPTKMSIHSFIIML